MTCREFTDFIMDYLEGGMPPEIRGPFERHLSRCPNCRTYLAQYRTTVAAGQEAFSDLDDSLPEDVPEELIQAILASRK